MPINDLLEFILYVVPGFLALEVYYLFVPRRVSGPFWQITWSIIIGALVFAIASWIDNALMGKWLTKNATGLIAFRFYLSLLILGIFIGLFLEGWRRIRFYISLKWDVLSNIAPDPQSIWKKINHPLYGYSDNWAIVFLRDGAIYSGWISQFKFDPSAIDQDFLLSEAKRVDHNLNELYIVDGLGVYLSTRDVTRIEFVNPQ